MKRKEEEHGKVENWDERANEKEEKEKGKTKQ